MKADALEALFGSVRQNFGTPWDFHAYVDWCFRFTVDACAEEWNAKADRYWSIQDNGLAQDGTTEIAWNNCEYKYVARWLAHSKHESGMGGCWVNLVASRPDTRWFRDATENDMGKLLRSYFVPETRVWWYVWQELVVGVFHHDRRLVFDVPPGTLDKKGNPVVSESAPFPSSLIIHAARAKYRKASVWPASKLKLYAPKGKEAEGNRLVGYPLLTYRMPE